MRLFTRYVLSEYLKIFGGTLLALTGILMIVGIVQEGVTQGLSPGYTVRLLPYLLPGALLFAVPGTVLFAASLVYGRMSNMNEVIALKACGINPLTILRPVLVLAACLSIVTLWLNDVSMSWGVLGVQRVLLTAVEDVVYGMLRTQRSYTTKQFALIVERVEGRKLLHPQFSVQPSGESPSVTIVAEEAEIQSKPGSGVLTMKFRNGTAEMGNATFTFPGTIERDIELDGSKLTRGRSPAHMSLRDLPAKIAEQHKNIETYQQQLAARAGFEMLSGDFDAMAPPNWLAAKRDLQWHHEQLHRLQTESPRRWANGFSCLCFALIGAPMAIRLKNADMLTSFFACFLPILLVYYPFLAYGVGRAKDGTLSPYCVWLANVVLIAWGLWLLKRVIRY